MSTSKVGKAWDERFSRGDWVYGLEPNVFMASQSSILPSTGRGLAVGDGEGRNGVWLAELGLDVLAVDASEVGCQKALRLAADRGVSDRYDSRCITLEDWNWPRESFDLIAAIFIHFPSDQRAEMHQRYVDAMRPGAMLVMECFTLKQLEYKTGGPGSPDLLYSAEMLREDFQDLEILQLEEVDSPLHEGMLHEGMSALVRLVARKNDREA